MAHDEGESSNFDELKTPGEEAAAEEPIFEDETAPAETAEDQVQPVEAVEAEGAETAEAAEESPEAEEEQAEAAPSKLPVAVELAVVIGIPVVMLGLFALNIIYISTAIYLMGLCYIPWGVWRGAGRTRSSPSSWLSRWPRCLRHVIVCGSSWAGTSST